MYLNDDANHVLTADELEYIVGQLTFGHDNRAGMDGSLHRISCIRNRSDRITGVTMRIGRCVPGNADIIKDLVHGEVCVCAWRVVSTIHEHDAVCIKPAFLMSIVEASLALDGNRL
jgi:hypothetical protein